MIHFKGFATKEEAETFKKTVRHGYLTYMEKTPKRKLLTARGKAYMETVTYGGLDPEKYPYCVQWVETVL